MFLVLVSDWLHTFSIHRYVFSSHWWLVLCPQIYCWVHPIVLSSRIIPYSAQLSLPLLFLLIIKVVYFSDILVVLVPISSATQLPPGPILRSCARAQQDTIFSVLVLLCLLCTVYNTSRVRWRLLGRCLGLIYDDSLFHGPLLCVQK